VTAEKRDGRWPAACLPLALGILLTAMVFSPFAAPQAAAQDSADKAEDYPDLPGRDETFGFCTGCHDFKLVAAQGMSRDAWDETLDWMVKRQGMADIQGEARTLVLDYLGKAFPAQRRTAPGGWRNPFAQ
jgi:hypothetical protein